MIFQGLFNVNYETPERNGFDERIFAIRPAEVIVTNSYLSSTKNEYSEIAAPQSITPFPGFNFISENRYNDEIRDAQFNQSKNEIATVLPISNQRLYNRCEAPNDFDMVHFE